MCQLAYKFLKAVLFISHQNLHHFLTYTCIYINFRHIRPAIDQTTASLIAQSFVASKLDYGNSLLVNTSASNMKVLTRIQNYAARLALWDLPHRLTSEQRLAHLHWLPLQKGLSMKLHVLCIIVSSRPPRFIWPNYFLPIPQVAICVHQTSIY